MTEERAVPIGAERRSDAIMAFLGAGLVQRPSRAQAADALAAARRGVASCQARGGAVSEWLADQVRRHGIGENAAVLAVLEIPDLRHQAAQAVKLSWGPFTNHFTLWVDSRTYVLLRSVHTVPMGTASAPPSRSRPGLVSTTTLTYQMRPATAASLKLLTPGSPPPASPAPR